MARASIWSTTAMPSELERSYAHCRLVAKTEAKNFYYSFHVLPAEQRASMCAIYAFMRYSDDISDDVPAPNCEGDARRRMERWREALDRAFRGDYGDSAILPAFHDTVRRHSIPAELFYDLIDGTTMDLDTHRYAAFADLYRYCYRVASVVGLVCIHVWGFSGAEHAYEAAEACGIAFQLTNILRDIKEDAERGRIYLPLEDLARFGYDEEELLRGAMNEPFRALMRYEAERAKTYYDRALPLVPLLSPEGRPAFVVMYRFYRGILDQIEAQQYDVFSARASLSKTRKAGILAQAWLGSRLPGGQALLRVSRGA